MGMLTQNGRLQQFKTRGQSGRVADVDFLMQVLAGENDIASTRLVDFALSLVDAPEGVAHLRQYLFSGTPRQRNYAALYFKRRGHIRLLEIAVAQGKIDVEQAFSK